MIALPTVVAWTLAISQGVQPEPDMEYFHRPTRAEIVEVLREAEQFAPVASKWAGYDIPWELAWVVGHEESNHAVFYRKAVKGRTRCAGYYGISVPAAIRFGAGLEGCGSMPTSSSAAMCKWLVSHPKQQVRILFRMAAFYLRDNGGNLYAFFGIWHHGSPDGCDYAPECRSIWRKRFPWPKDGRLNKR